MIWLWLSVIIPFFVTASCAHSSFTSHRQGVELDSFKLEHCTVPTVNGHSFMVASLTPQCTCLLTETQRLPCAVGLIVRLNVRAVFQTALMVLWAA